MNVRPCHPYSLFSLGVNKLLLMLLNFKKTFCYASTLRLGRSTTNKLNEWFGIVEITWKSTLQALPLLHLLDFCLLVKRLYMNHGMLLGYSFKPRPNSRALDAVVSVMTIPESINRCPHSKNLFDDRKHDWLFKSSGCRDFRDLGQNLLFSFSFKKKTKEPLLAEWWERKARCIFTNL